ncbi:hypothetical protein FKM82_029728, partial [Ascaphus truei]
PFPNSTNLLEEEILNSTLYRAPVDPANWFGIRKGYPNLGYIQNHLQILSLLVFEAVVYRHQAFYRKRYQLEVPHTQAVFPDVLRAHLDQGLLSCTKYFINYFFYKFGLEVSPEETPGGETQPQDRGVRAMRLYSKGRSDGMDDRVT